MTTIQDIDTIVVAREEETTPTVQSMDFEHIPLDTGVYSESDPLGIQALKDVESDVEDLQGDVQTLESTLSNLIIPTKVSDLTNDSGYITQDDVIIPTNVSDFINDAGYITDSTLSDFITPEALADFVTKTELAEGMEFGNMIVSDLTINGNKAIALPEEVFTAAINQINGSSDIAAIKTALVTLLSRMKENAKVEDEA